jgi:diacylglycerol kinase
MIIRYFKRFPHAIRGLYFGLKHDFGFRTQVYGIGLAVALALYFFSPLSAIEGLFLILAFFLILITELQNSALEIALDKLHPELHEAIGKSKDLAAAAVLLAGVFLLIIISTLCYSRF